MASRSKGANNVAEMALQIHAKVRAHLEAINTKYKVEASKHRQKKVFQEDDLVMMHLRRSHFPSIHALLEKQMYSPFRVARKINDNAYVLQLSNY